MEGNGSLTQDLATAILGIDTMWGGDVMNPSGMGRFIADSWFSDEPLPAAYHHAAAARLRVLGGVSKSAEAGAALDEYLAEIDVKGAIDRVRGSGEALGGLRGRYLSGLGLCFGVMWDLALEVADRGQPVAFQTCVTAVTGSGPVPSSPREKVEQVADLLEARHERLKGESLLSAIDSWRAARLVPRRSIPALGEAFIAQLDALTVKNVLPYIPKEMHAVPRANVAFLPIENAWFSGSMNYLGRARKADGSPEYEASYELNAALEISVPEFQQLVSHEVVPGHVTTFAYLQNLFFRGEAGFEASVLTMNTRAAALFEGIANNGVLMAHGVTAIEDLPDVDLRIGLLLALLQDDAKNQSAYLTWKEGLPKDEVARVLRNEFLVSEERADKLSGAWGQHPLLGRMYLPAYRFGTEKVAALRREHPPEEILPILYGCRGVVDVVTIDEMLAA
ncbi:MAG: hypothetical protein DIJKHBIC_03265 [Thermoanaerobaculia bacterium]|nr:hypothetical protein [Thermoanaerobaculia bacterium]